MGVFVSDVALLMSGGVEEMVTDDVSIDELIVGSEMEGTEVDVLVVKMDDTEVDRVAVESKVLSDGRVIRLDVVEVEVEVETVGDRIEIVVIAVEVIKVEEAVAAVALKVLLVLESVATELEH